LCSNPRSFTVFHLPQMKEIGVHLAATYLQLALAPVTFLLLCFVSAPYGRHGRSGFGPHIPFRLGWILMESPALFLFSAIYFSGSNRMNPISFVLYSLWTFHYTNRTLVLPLLRGKTRKSMPLLIAFLAFTFNSLNAYVNARWISHFAHYSNYSHISSHFAVGIPLFLVGLFINIRSDLILLNLGKKSQGYKIPRGFLFEYVSAPNYFGEIIEWFGWAIATNSWAGTAFALFTVANLLPRAASHHQWYRRTFKQYPSNRRRLVPFVW